MYNKPKKYAKAWELQQPRQAKGTGLNATSKTQKDRQTQGHTMQGCTQQQAEPRTHL